MRWCWKNVYLKRLLSLMMHVSVSQAIGAEYGEGFETFRMDGPLKVDVV